MTAQILDLLAYHYERSANGPKTREYLRRAGAAAAGRYALTEADAYFSRALELTPDADWEARYTLLQARREVVLDPSRRQYDLAELEALAEALDDDRKRAEVAGYRSQDTDDLAGMRAAAERMLALATAVADPALMIDAHNAGASALSLAREDAAAREHALLARDLARSAGDRKREAKGLFSLAIIAGYVGDLARDWRAGE